MVQAMPCYLFDKRLSEPMATYGDDVIAANLSIYMSVN